MNNEEVCERVKCCHDASIGSAQLKTIVIESGEKIGFKPEVCLCSKSGTPCRFYPVYTRESWETLYGTTIPFPTSELIAAE